jgi:CheY-like chemotaxis protein
VGSIGTIVHSMRYFCMPQSTPQRPGEDKPEAATILVVEDELLIRLMISEYLREFGYNVVEAQNAAEAREILRSDKAVEVVFSDIRMPGEMNGLGLAQWIERNKPGVGVVLTSAYVPPADLAAHPAAAPAIVPKPYVPNEVLSRIRAAING